MGDPSAPSQMSYKSFLQSPAPRTWFPSLSSPLALCFAFPRIFSSNLKERMAQRFYNLVLLPRVRDDIAEYKRLNFHLYMALKKALFKPGAWFKGRDSLQGCTSYEGAFWCLQQLGSSAGPRVAHHCLYRLLL